jgi:hypothetical protein
MTSNNDIYLVGSRSSGAAETLGHRPAFRFGQPSGSRPLVGRCERMSPR